MIDGDVWFSSADIDDLGRYLEDFDVVLGQMFEFYSYENSKSLEV